MQEDIECNWHPETISAAVAKTLRLLLQAGLLDRFYLAGGTGLALQLGHRRSMDLDFFSSDEFSVDSLEQRAAKLESFSVMAKGVNTLHSHIGGVKVSFLGYEYPVLFPLKEFQGARIADARDVACMKISAIAGRGTKRDFIDLYAAAQRDSLRSVMELFQRKFSRANYSAIHVLKSLTYFDEADLEPVPDVLMPLSWDEVKQFFRNETRKLI